MGDTGSVTGIQGDASDTRGFALAQLRAVALTQPKALP